MGMFDLFRRHEDPASRLSAMPDTMAVHQQFLDEALGVYASHDRFSGLAHAIAIWSVRKMGGERASAFVDAIQRAVQLARRGGVEK